VRINLAAAICWENYMPLVRQTLYSQNINLYLAPTADGRDTWLSLLRTAAIEGRCFVISSNMCARSSPPPASFSSADGHHTPAFHEDDADNETDSAEPNPIPTRTHRRASCVTEEGFEIALPNPPSAPSRRGQSTLDEDRNDISPRSAPPPPPSRRRQSIFDEDGNEIVLCAGISKRHTPKPTPFTPAATVSSAATKPEFSSRGGSAIISPFGDVLAGPQWEDDEGIISVDVDFNDCIRGRLDLDTAGSYSRNDSFKFAVEGLELTPLPY
jgi:nitrilase